jgi:hypothetical protein
LGLSTRHKLGLQPLGYAFFPPPKLSSGLCLLSPTKTMSSRPEAALLPPQWRPAFALAVACPFACHPVGICFCSCLRMSGGFHWGFCARPSSSPTKDEKDEFVRPHPGLLGNNPPKIIPGPVAYFSSPESYTSPDHVCHAFHHKRTTKTPRLETAFSKTPTKMQEIHPYPAPNALRQIF